MELLGIIIVFFIFYYFNEASKKKNSSQTQDKNSKKTEETSKSNCDIGTTTPTTFERKKFEKKATQISKPYVPKLQLKNYDHIFCLGIYIPYSRRDEFQDSFSKDILKLKNINQSIIYYFARELDCVVPDDVCLCMVPSSNPENTRTGITKIIEILATKKNRSNGAECLTRITPITPLKYGGNRNMQVHLDSIICTHQYKIKNKYVVLLDDVCTTGNSLRACAKILEINGAKAVMCIAVAKTKPIN